MKSFLQSLAITAALTGLILAVSGHIPFAASFENGPIENTQVVILVAGALYALYCARRDELVQLRRVDRFGAALLILLALRELSYGRVFFPIGMGPKGPEFIAMHDIPGHEIIYALLGLYMLALAYALVRYIPWRAILHSRTPWLPWLMALAGMALSTLGDKDMLGLVERSQVSEELGEVMLYAGLVLMLECYRHLIRQELEQGD